MSKSMFQKVQMILSLTIYLFCIIIIEAKKQIFHIQKTKFIKHNTQSDLMN